MMTTKRTTSAIAAIPLLLFLTGCSYIGLGGDDDRSLAPVSARSDNGAPAASGGTAPLQPGDKIRVSSWREEALTAEFVVDEDGTAVLPLLGSRKVTDVPASELKNRLVEDYESKFRNHTVGVTLLRRVSVLGAVNEPGIYHVDPTMTVSEAIALAGGPTDDGKPNDVVVHRNGRELDRKLSQRTPLRANLHSGDQLVIPKRSWFARNATFLIGTSISAATILLTRGMY